MTIEKKIKREFFEAIVAGKKKYELRLGDWECHEGDILRLREWDPDTKDYTGREVEKRVGYVKTFKLDELFWTKAEIEQHGLMVISLD
ncbi:MAG: DUF3850 domain-containing protein [bacterium]|nr:DUF3850 domain-containing protein [bacterium]